MKLTQKTIEAMTWAGKSPTDADVRWDDEIKGFGVRVWPTGKKTFVIRYRFQERRRYMTLGPYGVLSLQRARELARLRLAEVLQGVDPLERRRREATGETFGDLAREYLTRHSAPKKRNHKDDAQKLRDFVLPAWQSLKVEAITPQDVARLHHQIATGDVSLPKAARDRRAAKGLKRQPGGPGCANRTLALLSSVFNRSKALIGVDRGGALNPVTGIERYPETKRDRFVKLDELPKLAQAVSAEGDIFIRALIWLYLLTGMRKSELRTLKWADVDLGRDELRLPKTKAGRFHYLPISPAARQIFTALPRYVDHPYVFPGRVDFRPIVNVDDAWQRIRDAAGLGDVWLHDLRRTLGSYMAQSGHSLPLIGKVLNHSNPSTTQIYARFHLDPVAKALDVTSRQLIAGAQGHAPVTLDLPPTPPSGRPSP